MSDQQVVVYSPTIKRDVIELHYMAQWVVFLSSIRNKCEQIAAYGGTPINVFLPTIDEHYTEEEVCENAKARKAMLTWWIALFTICRSKTDVWIQNTQAMEPAYPAFLSSCVFLEDQNLARRFGILDSIKGDNGRSVILKSKDGNSQCENIRDAIAALAAKWEIPINVQRIDLKAVYERYHGGAGS